jgi:hypothetical protein
MWGYVGELVMKHSQENGGPEEDVSLEEELYEWWDDRQADDDLLEPSDLDEIEASNDDSRWEAFIADDDERDPLPKDGDFWLEDD